MGVAVLPCFMAQTEPTLRRLCPQVVASRPIFLVVHPDLARTARVRAVMDFLVETLASQADALGGNLVG
jgi:DNA-binding transcriptional LysR family regulator